MRLISAPAGLPPLPPHHLLRHHLSRPGRVILKPAVSVHTTAAAPRRGPALGGLAPAARLPVTANGGPPRARRRRPLQTSFGSILYAKCEGRKLLSSGQIGKGNQQLCSNLGSPTQ